jgi:hypothetical protein
MTPERIFRSARIARGLVPFNLPRPVLSSPFRRLAVHTIAMSVELLSCIPRSHHAVTLILSKDSLMRQAVKNYFNKS